MILDKVTEIMKAVGLGEKIDFYNGLGICRLKREEAVRKLPIEMRKRNLVLSDDWASVLPSALRADAIGGDYSVTNVWHSCSQAIRHSIDRRIGSHGFPANTDFFQFHNEEARRKWEDGNPVKKKIQKKKSIPKF